MPTLTRVLGRARYPQMLLAIVMVIAGAAAATGAMVVAQEDQPNEIQSCVNRVTGAVRIVQNSSDCTRYETPVTWNQQGPEGPQGEPGEKGDQGEPGEPGEQGEPGQACWDLNDNGSGDFPSEDLNGDGLINVDDCQGAAGLSAGFTNHSTTGTRLLYATGSDDFDNHSQVNGLVLPAGTYVIETDFRLFNVIQVSDSTPQHTVCYLTGNSSVIEDTLYSATAEEVIPDGPGQGSSGVTPVSTHFVLTFAEETTLGQHCFVNPLNDPSGLAGETAPILVDDPRITAIQLGSMDIQSF